MEASVSCPFDSSYESPSHTSSFPGNVQDVSKPSNGEQFFGNDLKTYFDKEEKNFLLSSLEKTGQEKSYLGPGAQSFLGQYNDSMVAQKLTISQYIAYRSEPLGHLGDSSCSQERPYFSYADKSSSSEEASIATPGIVPDFNEEPSWLVKKSLSLLSSSENIELDSSAEQTSENWLMPSNAKVNDGDFKMPAPVEPKKKQQPNDSELPSLYWKPTAEGEFMSLDTHNKQDVLEDCVSYLAGHIEEVKLVPTHPKYSSTQVLMAQDCTDLSLDGEGKSSRLSDHSLISEPQLSSTREITCDDADQSSIVSKVSTVRNNNCQPSQLSSDRSSSSAKQQLAKSTTENVNKTEESALRNDLQTKPEASILPSESILKSMPKSAACNPESWISLFTNTSSLSTPLLMNKVKEHILCIKGTSAHPGTVTFESSGVGESGFEITGTNGADRTVSSYLPEPSPPCPPSPVDVRPFPSKPVDISKSQRIESPTGSLISQESFSTRQRDSSSSGSLPSPRTSEQYAPVGVQEEALSKNSFLKCNKSQIFFGTAKIGDKQTGKLIIRNSSYEDTLILDMCIKDSMSFRIIDQEGKLVMNSRATLEPRQEQPINLSFQPTATGAFTAKLNIYPRSQSKKVKYSVDLLGYGGSSNLAIKNATRSRTLQPYFNGKSWSCSMSLENTGNLPGFVCVVPVFEPHSPVGPNNCVVLPSTLVLKEGSQSLVKVFIHCSRPNVSLKLQLFWVDEIVRACWRKCMDKGLPLQCDEASTIPWHRFWDPTNLSVNHAVCEDDVLLFMNSLKREEVIIASSDACNSSNFVSLAMETATLLEHSSMKTDRSALQNVHPNLSKLQRDAVKSVSVNVNEIVFPLTKVGSSSTMKIPLQNWSSAIQEVEIREIQEPFRLKHLQCKIPGGYFYNLPITFQPTKIGNYSSVIVFEIKGLQSVLRLPVKGVAA